MGPDVEDPTFAHGDPAAVVAHLEAFLGHQAAWPLLKKCGIEAVNGALSELPYTDAVHSPPAFFTARTRAIAKGAKPIVKPSRRDDDRNKHVEEYERRRGPL